MINDYFLGLDRCSLFSLILLVLVGQATANETLPLLIAEDFEQGMNRWTTTDLGPAQVFWQVTRVRRESNANQVMRVKGKSNYNPPHRSPHSIAILNDLVVGDFELTVDVQNTNRNAGAHRDLCLFWGYQDPAHFYYVHLGANPDPHSCQIFIVDEAPRTMITTIQSKGTPWTDGWHRVKVERRVENGSMKVYFDDMRSPVMIAEDTTFQWGQIGVGTFDDHGNFDNIILHGKKTDPH